MLRILFTYFSISIFSLSAGYAQSSPPAENKNKSSKIKNRIAVIEDKISAHPPRLAMIFSACVPGLGQAYNKKYWKIPIVYATMGTTYYFFDYNNKLYKEYIQAYINKTDSLPGTIDLYPDESADVLLKKQNYHRRYRDLGIIFMALFHTLNIVDAYVDAHLMTFDVSDDLSLNIYPALDLSAQRKNPSLGLTFSFKF